MKGLQEWLAEKAAGGFYLYIKRLSANDTGATGGHQSGLYLPSVVAKAVLPSICHNISELPEKWIDARICSHDFPEVGVRAVNYNSRHFGKSRNEKRITRWGKHSPLQDTNNTGALTLIAFNQEPDADSKWLEVWVCTNPDQESIAEAALGEVVPGTYLHGFSEKLLDGLKISSDARQKRHLLPDEWKDCFPSGKVINEWARRHCPKIKGAPDDLLMSRRQTEFEIYLQIEDMHFLSDIRQGFSTVEEFTTLAKSVSNQRKSRSGRSLELHLQHLFAEFGVEHFDSQAVTEGKKKPDFLFPSAEAYQDETYPVSQLRMLAVKTTCKDRWRQVLSEADRIKNKHLFTLQEGVSVPQFQEMQRAGITLVVPASIHAKYPTVVRAHLLTLGQFISDLIRLHPSD